MPCLLSLRYLHYRRSSHEERGLKFLWLRYRACLLCRSSHEERGLKLFVGRKNAKSCRRSSHEERGLKLIGRWWHQAGTQSLLA